jgi:hypothetical protein
MCVTKVSNIPSAFGMRVRKLRTASPAELPLGWRAWRDEKDAPWTLAPREQDLQSPAAIGTGRPTRRQALRKLRRTPASAPLARERSHA